jgi:hypothetical protein
MQISPISPLSERTVDPHWGEGHNSSADFNPNHNHVNPDHFTSTPPCMQPSSKIIVCKQCCGSGMFIPDPGSRISDPGSRILDLGSRIPDFGSRILDPGSRIQKQQQKTGVKKNLLSYLFCSYKFHKIENYCIFEMRKKKIWANFQRIVELFAKKIVTKFSKIWVWDPGSEICDPGSGIRDLGSWIRDPRSGIRDPGSEIRDPEKSIPDPESRIQGSKRHRIQDHGSGSATLYVKCTGLNTNL